MPIILENKNGSIELPAKKNNIEIIEEPDVVIELPFNSTGAGIEYLPIDKEIIFKEVQQ